MENYIMNLEYESEGFSWWWEPKLEAREVQDCCDLFSSEGDRIFRGLISWLLITTPCFD